MPPASAEKIDAEKVTGDDVLIEHVSETKDETSDESNIVVNSERRAEQERRLVRKLDMRLLPMVFIIYVMNYIDASNRTLSTEYFDLLNRREMLLHLRDSKVLNRTWVCPVR